MVNQQNGQKKVSDSSNSGVREIIKYSVISLAVAAIVFFLGIFIYYVSFRLFIEPASFRVKWDLLEGFASLFTLALFIGGLVFTAVQYFKAEARERQEKGKLGFEVYEALFDRLMSDEGVQARRWIFQNLLKPEEEGGGPIPSAKSLEIVRSLIRESPSDWPNTEIQTPGEKYVKQTLNTLDFMGFVMRNYITDDDALMAWMSPPIAKSWVCLREYVDAECQRRGEKDYYADAKYIGEKCIVWRVERGLLGVGFVPNAL